MTGGKRSEAMARHAAATCIMIFVLLGMVRPMSADDAAAGLQSMQAFLRETPGCIEFTDQCSICRLVEGQAMCSIPSTTCIKKDYVCTRQSEE